MSSKPFFKKSLKGLLKLDKEIVEEAGEHLFQMGDFNFNFQGFAGVFQ